MIGASGGIFTLWKTNNWELIHQKKELHWIKTYLKNKNSKEIYWIVNICAPNHYNDKEICWTALKNYLLHVQNRGIIIGEDLNLVLNIEEKFGGKYNVDPSR